MVSRNRDSMSLALGIAGSIIGVISVILCCIGVALPTWYVGTTANYSNNVAEANLFYSCYAPNATQGTILSTHTCVSFNSYSCSTTSYEHSVFNTTAYVSGCTNPNSDASIYIDFDAPIYQTSLHRFYRLRAAAALSIISILFISFSVIFGFITGIMLLNIYLVLVAPILACIAVVSGASCLIVAGSVFNYTGIGFALFATGILLEVIVVTLLSISAGRLNGLRMTKDIDDDDDQPMFIQRPDSRVVVRRVIKRRM